MATLKPRGWAEPVNHQSISIQHSEIIFLWQKKPTMRSETQKPFFKRLLIFMASGIFLLFLAYGIFGDKGYLQLKKVELQNQKLRLEIEHVKDENQQMMLEIKALKTDPKTIEKIAREELGMVKPGEVKITIAKPESKPHTGSLPEPESVTNPTR